MGRAVRPMYPGLVLGVLALMILLKAWGYAAASGDAFDIAVFYQAWHSVMLGHLLGDTVTTGIPYLVEHFVPLIIPMAPLSLLPPNMALGVWWGLTIALFMIAAEELANSLGMHWEDALLLLLASAPLILVTPTEYLLWSAFAPIGYLLYVRGSRKSGIAFLVLGLLSMEYLPEYLVFVLDFSKSFNDYLVKKACRVPWFALAMIIIVIAQATYFVIIRDWTGLANIVYKGHVFGSPLSTVVPQPVISFAALLKVISVVTTAPLIPVLLLGFDFVTWNGVVMLIIPFISTAAFFSLPFIYYLYPFYVTSIALVLIVRPWLVKKLLSLATVYFIATLLVLIIISTASWFIGHGVSYIPPPSPYTAIPIALAQVHLPMNGAGAVMSNGIVCGYGYVLALHCALNDTALTIVQPSHVIAYVTLTKPLAITAGNTAFNANPPVPPGNYTVYEVLLSGREIGSIYVPSSANTTRVINITMSELLTTYAESILTTITSILTTLLISYETYRVVKRYHSSLS